MKDHKPIVNTELGVIKIWNDEKGEYEMHTFEFIESLYNYVRPYFDELVVGDT
jgi:hypothetical protein